MPTAGERDDPFDGLQLDDEFVRGATRHEAAADERIARLQRIDRGHLALRESQEREREEARRAGRTGRRRRRGRLAVIVVLVGALLAVGFWWSARRGPNDLAHVQAQAEGKRPPASGEEQPEPLGQPPAAPAGEGGYRFVRTQDGSDEPVAYSPCRPIHVVVNQRTAPPNADVLLREALDRTSAATGLRFVVDGTTDEPATGKDRASYQPDRYPDRWAPVLVSWSDPAEVAGLAGGTAGEAGSASIEVGGRRVFVTGGVTLDGPDFAAMFARPDGAAHARAVLLHELGHLLGLDHVPDTAQVMSGEENPRSERPTDYAPGDLRGLARLGQGQCFPSV